MTVFARYRAQLGISLRVVRAILRNPSLRRVELAFLLFNTVEFGTWVAILLYAYEAIGPASVGLVAVVQLVPGAVLAPFIAGFGDRFRRDRVLFLGYVLQTAKYGVTSLGIALLAPPVLVVVAATCAATALSITRPAQGSLVPSLSRTPEELTAANGLSGAMEGTGMLLGPLLAAAILAVATPAGVFGAATIGCLVAAGLALVAVGLVAVASTAAILVILAGCGFAACDVVGRTILQRATPDLVLSRVLGALEGIDFAGLALGSLLAPIVALAIGVQPAMIAFGVVLPVGLVLAWAGLQAIDRHALVPVRAIALLREDVVFAPLPQASIEWLARQTRWLTIERGQVLIAEGDAGDAYYVLESGALAVTKGGVPIRVCERRGEGVGEIALLRDVRRTATVTARDPSVLLVVRRQEFLEVVAGHPASREAAQQVVAARPA